MRIARWRRGKLPSRLYWSSGGITFDGIRAIASTKGRQRDGGSQLSIAIGRLRASA